MKKLKLKDLKVESFVTSLDKENSETLKGGYITNEDGVDTLNQNCSFESKFVNPCDDGTVIWCNFSDCCTRGRRSC